MRSRQPDLDHKKKSKQKKNDYIKSADAVRGEASLVGLMGDEVVRRWHRDFFNVRLHPSTQSAPPAAAATTRPG